MAKECPYCGAEMPELDSFCTKCGLGTQAYSPINRQPVRKNSGFRWWMIPLILVLIGAVLVIVMWSRFSLYFAPEMQLAEALSDTGERFAQRMEGSPLVVVTQAANWEEGYTSNVSLDLSVVGYDGFGASVTSVSDRGSHSFMVSSQQRLFGMTKVDSVYSGREQVVFVQETPVGSLTYSLLFDSLSQAVEGDVFSRLDADERESVAASLEALRMPTGDADPTALNKRYVQIMIGILKESERRVGYENRTLEGKKRNCGVISYTLNNYILAQGLDALAQVAREDEALRNSFFSRRALSELELVAKSGESPADIPTRLQHRAEELRQDRNGGISITFHLYDKKLVRICYCRETQGSVVFSLDAEVGLDAAVSDIFVTVQNGEGQSSYLFRTEKNGNLHADQLTITTQGHTETVSCTWDSQTSALPVTLLREGETLEINGQLNATEDGFTLELPNVLGLLEADGFGAIEFVQTLTQLDLRVEVSRGGEVLIPEGKPIEEWTPKDINLIRDEFLN